MSRLLARLSLCCVIGHALACDGGGPSTHAPPRPLLVPSTAAWVASANASPAGASWVDCWRVSDVQRADDGREHPELDDRFDCKVFDARGAVQQQGRMRLLDVDDAGLLHPASQPRRVLQFQAVEGCRLRVVPGRQMVPEALVRCDGSACTAAPCTRS